MPSRSESPRSATSAQDDGASSKESAPSDLILSQKRVQFDLNVNLFDRSPSASFPGTESETPGDEVFPPLKHHEEEEDVEEEEEEEEGSTAPPPREEDDDSVLVATEPVGAFWSAANVATNPLGAPALAITPTATPPNEDASLSETSKVSPAATPEAVRKIVSSIPPEEWQSADGDEFIDKLASSLGIPPTGSKKDMAELLESALVKAIQSDERRTSMQSTMSLNLSAGDSANYAVSPNSVPSPATSHLPSPSHKMSDRPRLPQPHTYRHFGTSPHIQPLVPRALPVPPLQTGKLAALGGTSDLGSSVVEGEVATPAKDTPRPLPTYSSVQDDTNTASESGRTAQWFTLMRAVDNEILTLQNTEGTSSSDATPTTLKSETSTELETSSVSEGSGTHSRTYKQRHRGVAARDLRRLAEEQSELKERATPLTPGDQPPVRLQCRTPPACQRPPPLEMCDGSNTTGSPRSPYTESMGPYQEPDPTSPTTFSRRSAVVVCVPGKDAALQKQGLCHLESYLLSRCHEVRVLTTPAFETRCPSKPPTKANIQSEIAWLVNSARAGDFLYLAFIGSPGQLHPSDPLGIPEGFTPAGVSQTGLLSAHRIASYASRVPTGATLLVVSDLSPAGCVATFPCRLVATSGGSVVRSDPPAPASAGHNGTVLVVGGLPHQTVRGMVGGEVADGAPDDRVETCGLLASAVAAVLGDLPPRAACGTILSNLRAFLKVRLGPESVLPVLTANRIISPWNPPLHLPGPLPQDSEIPREAEGESEGDPEEPPEGPMPTIAALDVIYAHSAERRSDQPAALREPPSHPPPSLPPADTTFDQSFASLTQASLPPSRASCIRTPIDPNSHPTPASLPASPQHQDSAANPKPTAQRIRPPGWPAQPRKAFWVTHAERPQAKPPDAIPARDLPERSVSSNSTTDASCTTSSSLDTASSYSDSSETSFSSSCASYAPSSVPVEKRHVSPRRRQGRGFWVA